MLIKNQTDILSIMLLILPFYGFFLTYSSAISSTSSELVPPIKGTQGSRATSARFDLLNSIKRSMPLFVNKTLTVCVVVREPFVIYNEPDSTVSKPVNPTADLNNYSGVAIEVVKRLAHIFKFKLRIIRPSDNQFGVSVPGKGWTGLMGTLVRNESDIGVTALSITVSRARVIDFTRAYFVETVAILLRTPEEIQNYLAIFEPFSLTVWIVLLVTMIVLIVLIAIMTKLEDNQRHQQLAHKLAKFVSGRNSLMRGGSGTSFARSSTVEVNTIEKRPSEAEEFERRYSRQLRQKIKAVEEARKHHEFGSTWLDRFYYATSCVLNILLIRGKSTVRLEFRCFASGG